MTNYGTIEPGYLGYELVTTVVCAECGISNTAPFAIDLTQAKRRFIAEGWRWPADGWALCPICCEGEEG